ncbi:hypothetical protein [Flavobacterium sp.]|uniref:hypothetical protein n=1 Tax=Flavobacterium sp. TaxID=239 RepID=UPI00374CEBB8
MINFFKNLFKKNENKITILRTSEVFKISGVPIHTFVERLDFNARINEFFTSKDNVLLFLGYSKSGKTVYRKKHLEKDGFKIITFRCNNESTINQLYDPPLARASRS